MGGFQSNAFQISGFQIYGSNTSQGAPIGGGALDAFINIFRRRRR